MVEHLTFNQRVEGSSPSWLTIFFLRVAELADALESGSSVFTDVGFKSFIRIAKRGSSSVVEHHPEGGVAGSNPVFRSNYTIPSMPGWWNWQTHRT